MNTMNPSASVIWRGYRHEGAGTWSTGSDALSKAPFSLEANTGTSTDELIGAALASFSATLARELTPADIHPECSPVVRLLKTTISLTAPLEAD